MIQFTIEIKDKQVIGEPLILKLLKAMRTGRYRCELYSLDKRSLNQNSYLHTVFALAQKGLYNAGYQHVTSPGTAKDFFKAMFLTTEAVNEQTGEVYKYVRHTADLSKEEMAHFIDLIIEHSLNYLGVMIPTPEAYLADYNRYDLVALSK